MENRKVSILENVKINQNLICLIVSFIFLYYSKDYCCCYKWIYAWSKFLFWISFISVCISALFYIVEYCFRKYVTICKHYCNIFCNNKAEDEKS